LRKILSRQRWNAYGRNTCSYERNSRLWPGDGPNTGVVVAVALIEKVSMIAEGGLTLMEEVVVRRRRCPSSHCDLMGAMT